MFNLSVHPLPPLSPPHNFWYKKWYIRYYICSGTAWAGWTGKQKHSAVAAGRDRLTWEKSAVTLAILRVKKVLMLGKFWAVTSHWRHFLFHVKKCFLWNLQEYVTEQSSAHLFAQSRDDLLVKKAWEQVAWCEWNPALSKQKTKLTTCLRKGCLLRFPLNSKATSDGGAQKVGNDLWHNSFSIATKVCSQIARKLKAMFESHAMM